MINPHGLLEGVNIRYCNIPWLHSGHMGIMLLTQWSCRRGSGGGGCRPLCKKSMRGSLEI